MSRLAFNHHGTLKRDLPPCQPLCHIGICCLQEGDVLFCRTVTIICGRCLWVSDTYHLLSSAHPMLWCMPALPPANTLDGTVGDW
jgi:hypothetical protein